MTEATVTYRVAKRLGVEPPLRRKAIQAKHIPDQEVIDAYLAYEANRKFRQFLRPMEYTGAIRDGTALAPPVSALAHKYPEKVLLAKMASMERRGILDPLTNTVWTVNPRWLREHPQCP